MKKNVVIKLVTSRRDADDDLIDMIDEIIRKGIADDGADDGAIREALDFLEGNDALSEGMPCDAEELITEGYMETDGDGNVEISYEESEIGGLEGSRVRLVFNENAPKLVSMIREGTVSTMLSYEEGKRHKSIYRTPYMNFELTLNTSTVDNRILDEGTLTLCYIMEIRGLSVSRCRLKLSVT